VAVASEVPGTNSARFDADAFPSASDAQLDTLRGGFDFGGGLAVSLGFVRSITINGGLVSQIHFTLPDLSHITVDQAKMVSDALAQAHIIQNGLGNSVPTGYTSSGSTTSASPPNVNVSSAGSSPSASAPVVTVPVVNQPTVSLPSSGLSTTTILQNSLNNQTLQTLTKIDAGVNSLGILRSINSQAALRDALFGALGIH
jgi:hypothetical protein